MVSVKWSSDKSLPLLEDYNSVNQVYIHTDEGEDWDLQGDGHLHFGV